MSQKFIYLPVPAGTHWCDVKSLLKSAHSTCNQEAPAVTEKNTESKHHSGWIEVTDPYAEMKKTLTKHKACDRETRQKQRHQDYVSRRDATYLQSSREYDRKRQRWQAAIDKLQNKHNRNQG